MECVKQPRADPGGYSDILVGTAPCCPVNDNLHLSAIERLSYDDQEQPLDLITVLLTRFSVLPSLTSSQQIWILTLLENQTLEKQSARQGLSFAPSGTLEMAGVTFHSVIMSAVIHSTTSS
jgi:hypothetical protein